MMFERLQRLAERLQGYPWWQVAIELLLIWLVIFIVFRFVQGTRAAGALKGTLFLIILATLVMRILGQQEAFQRIKFLYDTFLTLLAITLIVVFQPELRRGLIRLGETPLIRRTSSGTSEVIEALVDTAEYLSKAKFGGLVVIARETPLKGLIEGGTPIGGRVSSQLLQTIFYPGSALHDLAVIIHGGIVSSAGVQLPLADPEDMPDRKLGSRHRAAVGLSKECDALVLVISEETGGISIAQRGRLVRGLTPERLREVLTKGLRKESARAARAAAVAETRDSSDDSKMGSMLGESVAGVDAIASSSSAAER